MILGVPMMKSGGFVSVPEHWRYSSAIDYSGGKGLIEIDFVWKR